LYGGIPDLPGYANSDRAMGRAEFTDSTAAWMPNKAPSGDFKAPSHGDAVSMARMRRDNFARELPLPVTRPKLRAGERA